MTQTEQIITVAIVALATLLTRLLPFLIFKSNKPTPRFLIYIGRALPPAVFGMLVVYCLKEVSFGGLSLWAPQLIALSATLLIHLAFRKMLLSIAGGTALYIILVNWVFI